LEIEKYNPPSLNDNEDIGKIINNSLSTEKSETAEDEEKESVSAIDSSLKKLFEEQKKQITEKLDLFSNNQDDGLKHKVNSFMKKQEELLLSLEQKIEKIHSSISDSVDESGDKKIEIFETLNKNSADLLKFIENMEDKNKILIKKILFKILEVEISNNSEKIITHFLKSVYDNIKKSKEIKIKLSNEDYLFLKDNIKEELGNPLLNIEADSSVKKGGVVVFSDSFNYENDLENKLELIMDSIF